MSIYNALKFVGEDTRVRRYLLPEAVVLSGGLVTGRQNLLKQKSMQISTVRPAGTRLQNKANGKNAFVVLDFGTELQGGIRILGYDYTEQLSIQPNVRITFGESLSEACSNIGEKNATNDHSVRQITVPLPRYSDQEWGNTGFRFVRIELLSSDCFVEIKSILAVSVMHDFPYIGSFCCDDENINRIYDTAAYSCHLCLQNLVWDGIKRDRLVWIGDMMPESMAVRTLFGNRQIVEDSLDFVRLETPLPKWMNDIPTYSMWWIMILRDWYMATGDKKFLNRQRKYLTGLLNQLCDLVSPEGVRITTWWMFDWQNNDSPAHPDGVTSILKMSLRDGAYLARIFGDEALEKRCAAAESMIAPSEHHDDSKQIAAFLALSGRMPYEKVVPVMKKNGSSGFSTFLSYFSFKALALAGEIDTALDLMKEYHNGMLENGATSFWEDFNPQWTNHAAPLTNLPQNGQKDLHGDFGDFCYVGYRHSLCHGWSAGPVPFLAECVLGVQILEPGCKTLKIEPHLGNLKFACGDFPTPYGTVHMKHTKDAAGTVHTEIDAPKQIKIITA